MRRSVTVHIDPCGLDARTKLSNRLSDVVSCRLEVLSRLRLQFYELFFDLVAVVVQRVDIRIGVERLARQTIAAGTIETRCVAAERRGLAAARERRVGPGRHNAPRGRCLPKART